MELESPENYNYVYNFVSHLFLNDFSPGHDVLLSALRVYFVKI